MKVLANPDRLLILCELSQGERCVGELEAMLDIVQPTLSQQLTGAARRATGSAPVGGRERFYRLASRQALAVMQTLYQQFCRGHRSAAS
jgi:ArsR family transcriptional regulator